ncbi:PI-actitoxin-Afv2a-like [Gigantopelta aegis]|uniref:PI-actitoxin-Afv2a-like n=1 Tax=Gigantopelta aegis TaxID=1735272 RepID=UPI001B88E0BA|nr:PI-actitoxin-Afv2a-like [Gigantopelta aegis]
MFHVLIVCMVLCSRFITVTSSDPVCLLPASPGWCQGDANVTTRWYWNMFARTCFGFPYLGCGGNSNNFKTKDDCLRTCTTTKS